MNCVLGMRIKASEDVRTGLRRTSHKSQSLTGCLRLSRSQSLVPACKVAFAEPSDSHFKLRHYPKLNQSQLELGGHNVQGVFFFLAAASNACEYGSVIRIPGIASEIAVVLLGVCIGTVRLAIKDFRAYKRKSVGSAPNQNTNPDANPAAFRLLLAYPPSPVK